MFKRAGELKIKEMVSLTEFELDIYESLNIECLFCEDTNVTLREYQRHSMECEKWPIELVIERHQQQDHLISDPHFTTPMNEATEEINYRLVDFYFKGKKMKEDGRNTSGYARMNETVRNLCKQAAKKVNKRISEISLVYSTHRVLDPYLLIKDILKYRYNSLTIVDKNIAQAIEGRRLKISVGEQTKDSEQSESSTSNDTTLTSQTTSIDPRFEWNSMIESWD